MSALTKSDSTKVRATHRSWGTEINSRAMFRNVVTLDPTLTEDTWMRLSVYTPAVELRELPLRLHKSLVKALSVRLHRGRVDN